MGFPAGPLSEAPASLGASSVSRIADADGPLAVSGRSGLTVITLTAARALALPPLASVQNGDGVTLKVFGAFIATITPNGTDKMNDAIGSLATGANPAGEHVSFVADLIGGTWISLQ